MLRVKKPARNLAHAVPGTAYPLQTGSHRRRRRHLNNRIHMPHIDAELQGTCGDHTPQRTILEGLFDKRALILRHRTVMRPRQRRNVRFLTNIRQRLTRKLAP